MRFLCEFYPKLSSFSFLHSVLSEKRAKHGMQKKIRVVVAKWMHSKSFIHSFDVECHRMASLTTTTSPTTTTPMMLLFIPQRTQSVGRSVAVCAPCNLPSLICLCAYCVGVCVCKDAPMYYSWHRIIRSVSRVNQHTIRHQLQ